MCQLQLNKNLWPPKQINYIAIPYPTLKLFLISTRENRSGNQEWTIQRIWQHWTHKTETNKTQHNTICVGHHHTQTHTTMVNMTWVLLLTTGDKDELNIVLFAHLAKCNVSIFHQLASVVCRPLTFHSLFFSSETP
jgi:hypothetical protein